MYDKYLSWMLDVCKPMKLPIETDLVGDVLKKVQENENKKFFFCMKSGTLPLQTMSKITGKSIMFNKNPRAIDFMEKENLEILERKMKEADSSFKFSFSIDEIVKLKGIEHQDLHFESDEKLKKLLKDFEKVCENLVQMASSSKTYRGPQFGSDAESQSATTSTPKISTAAGSRSSLSKDTSSSSPTPRTTTKQEFPSTSTPRTTTVVQQQEYEGQEDRAAEMRKMKREIQELREQELKKLEKFIEDRKRDEERVIKNECSKVKQQMLNDIECERSELMSKIRQEIHSKERELKQKMEENLEKEEEKIKRDYEARIGKKLAKEYGEEVNMLNLEIKRLKEELNDKNLEIRSLQMEYDNRITQLEEDRDAKMRRREDEIFDLKDEVDRLRRELATAKLNVEEMLKLKEEGELREQALSAQVVKAVGDDEDVDDLEPLEEDEEDFGLQLQIPKLQIAKAVSEPMPTSVSPKPPVSPHQATVQKGTGNPPPPPPSTKASTSVSVKEFIEKMSNQSSYKSLPKTNSSIKPKTIKDDTEEEIIELQTPVLKKETTSTVIPKKEFNSVLKNMKDMY